MPFYLVTQKGMPGARLVEADKPQQARDHVISDTFEVTRVDGRELLDAAADYEPEFMAAREDKKPADQQDTTPPAGEDGGEQDDGPASEEQETDQD